MADETLRSNLDRAFDSGPGYPDPLLLSRTMAMLEAHPATAGRAGRWKDPERSRLSWPRTGPAVGGGLADDRLGDSSGRRVLGRASRTELLGTCRPSTAARDDRVRASYQREWRRAHLHDPCRWQRRKATGRHLDLLRGVVAQGRSSEPDHHPGGTVPAPASPRRS